MLASFFSTFVYHNLTLANGRAKWVGEWMVVGIRLIKGGLTQKMKGRLIKLSQNRRVCWWNTTLLCIDYVSLQFNMFILGNWGWSLLDVRERVEIVHVWRHVTSCLRIIFIWLSVYPSCWQLTCQKWHVKKKVSVLPHNFQHVSS